MADTFSPLLRLILQEEFANINLWGAIYNSGVIDLLEESLCGVSLVDVDFGNVDLSAQNGLTDSARPMFLDVQGNPGVNVTVTLPTLHKLYFVSNNTSPSVTVSFKTALSAAISVTAAQSPCIIFVDAANNRVRHLGRANGIVPMTAFTTLNTAIVNRTAGDTSVNLKYAKQGHLVTLYVPAHTFTTSDGSWGFAAAIPAAIAPGEQQTFYPAYANGLAANARAAFFINPALVGAKWGMTNVGTAGFGAGPFNMPANLTYVYSTRT